MSGAGCGTEPTAVVEVKRNCSLQPRDQLVPAASVRGRERASVFWPPCCLWQGPWDELQHHKHPAPARHAFTTRRKGVKGVEFPLSVDNYCCL